MAALAVVAAVLIYPLVVVWRKTRAALQRAPRPLALAVKGGIWLAVAVGVVVGIMRADSCYGCDEWDLVLGSVAVAVLAALLTAAGLAAVLLFGWGLWRAGWGLWRAAGVVATNPHAAVFAVFVAVILVLAVVLVAVLV